MLHIHPIPAFDDNYIWLLHNTRDAVVVDPGDAAPVIKAMKNFQLNLKSILITHHHADHICGVQPLIELFSPRVFAPQYEQYAFEHHALAEGDTVELPEIEQTFKVMWLPGHTLGHIAYVNEDSLFCGDTLFGAGCGRLFEGTPLQMFNSLNRLKELNTSIKVYCTHEYTAKNIAFALTLEPDNLDLIKRQNEVAMVRSSNTPSLPSTIGIELKTNPYFRCDKENIRKNAHVAEHNELSVFTVIRNLRNHY